MKVMSYNIQFGEGLDEKNSLSRIANNILKSEAVVIATQEVDRHYSERSNYLNQAQELADLLQFNHVFGSNLILPSEKGHKKTREYGTAIFSRYPIIESENIYLTSFGKEQRGLLRAKIAIAGTHINVYNTHLGLDETSREKQITEIMEILSKEKRPYILMGDFNAKPDSEEILLIQEKADLKDVFELVSNAYTYTSIDPTVRIDYIFVSQQIKYRDSEVLDLEGSDHLPITTHISF